MMRNFLFLFTLIAMTGLHGIAQQVVSVVPGDTVTLDAGTRAVGVQWQISSDGISYSPIDHATTHVFKTVVKSTPSYFRAKVDSADCSGYSETITVEFTPDRYYWSDPAAWPDSKPGENEVVEIPMGKTIILNENTPELGGLVIHGTLRFAEKDLELKSRWIMVHGTMQAGSELSPFKHKLTLTLTDTDVNEDVMGMGTRGIVVMGGTLDLFGKVPRVTWTKVRTHAVSGANTFEFADTTDWNAGDEVIVTTTDYYHASRTERSFLATVVPTGATANSPLESNHWGLLQYPTAQGMSLSQDNLISAPASDSLDWKTPLVLDERAEVANLTRNIVIQAPDDATWKDKGFGVHIMIMPGSQARFDGVEIRRAGQAGRIRRYPFHWHNLSYAGGLETQDASGQFIRNSSIHDTQNRGIVIHGTNGVEVRNNVLYNIRGHAIFTEDAVERRNVIDHNLVATVRNPATPLKLHETGEFGSSGFWISNPDNTVTGNVAADCQGIGFWLTFPVHPWGDHQDVKMNPSRLQFGKFDGNIAHSNRTQGIRLDDVEIFNDGTTFPFQYMSTTDGENPEWPFPTLRRFSLSNCQVWKNSGNGIWDRSVWPDTYGIVSADNCGRFFAGSGDNGRIDRSLVVGTSLNHQFNTAGRPAEADYSAGFKSSDPVAFATYHSTFDISNNVVINFQAKDGTRGGVFATDDYYTRAVEKGQLRNTNNLIINSHPGVKLPAVYSYYTLASALWDPYGLWGPASNYVVYNHPFLTYGKEVTQITPDAQTSGGVSVSGPFYGFEGFVLHGVGDTPPQNQPYFDLMGLKVRRLNADFTELATWTVPEAQTDYVLQHMRDFATSPGSIYELTFPQETDYPTNFQVNVENMLTANDTQVIGVQFDGTLNPSVYMVAYSSWTPYSKVNSLQEVLSSTGETWWQDKANNLVWVKLQGGRWKYWTTNASESVPTKDELLYETTQLKIIGE